MLMVSHVLSLEHRSSSVLWDLDTSSYHRERQAEERAP
jgi:hypothetical protein